MIFGKQAPKFIYDEGGGSEETVLLDNVVIMEDGTEPDEVVHESPLTKHRNFIDNGEHYRFKVMQYIFKDDPYNKYMKLNEFKNKLVTLYRHRDNPPFQDSDENNVLFKVRVQPQYLETIEFRDVVIVTFISQDPVDVSKSAEASVGHGLVDGIGARLEDETGAGLLDDLIK